MIKLHKVEEQTFTDSKDRSEKSRIAIFLGDDGSIVHYFDSWRQMQDISISMHEDPEYKAMLIDIVSEVRDSKRPLARKEYTAPDTIRGDF